MRYSRPMRSCMPRALLAFAFFALTNALGCEEVRVRPPDLVEGSSISDVADEVTPVALGTLGLLFDLRKSRWRLLVGATATLWLLYSGVMHYGLLTLY